MTTEAVRIKDIALQSIDYDNLEDVEENREAVKFTVTLSDTPTETWIQEFEQAYRGTPYQIKPPLQVIGNKFNIIYLPRYAPELDSFFRFLKLMTQRANTETRLTEEIHAAGNRDRKKNDLREALKRISL